jgi:hypothetical protein
MIENLTDFEEYLRQNNIKFFPTGSRIFGIATETSDYDYTILFEDMVSYDLVRDICSLIGDEKDIIEVSDDNDLSEYDEDSSSSDRMLYLRTPFGRLNLIIFETWGNKYAYERFQAWVIATKLFTLMLSKIASVEQKSLKDKDFRIQTFREFRADIYRAIRESIE